MAKVEIKVLIDKNGKYCGYGYSGAVSSELDDTLYEVFHDTPLKEYWITADLPIPVAEAVTGDVSETKPA